MLGKKGGAYLMKHPQQLYPIIKDILSYCTIPLTVKMRSGWDDESINAVEIAKELETLGVARIIIHPRTKEQGYKDKANWDLARQVKNAVSIPVTISGDIKNAYLAKCAQQHTKCDGIMIGRAAKVNPSVFKTIRDGEVKSFDYQKTQEQAKIDFLEFLELYKAREKRYRFSELQDHAIWSITELPNASNLKQNILLCCNEAQLVDIFKKL